MSIFKTFNIIAAFLCLALCLSVFAACKSPEQSTETGSESKNQTEAETTVDLTQFDYFAADISDYATVDPSLYHNTSATISSDYIIDDEDIDAYIDSQRFAKKTVKNDGAQCTDQPIKLGDSAFIYYTGYLDGVEFEGGSNADDEKPHELSIGSGNFVPGFEDGLIGIIPSDTSKDSPAEISVTFPESYYEDLAGKSVIFKVWVVYTVQYEIPEYTDEYIADVLKFQAKTENVKQEHRDYVKAALELQIEDSRNQAIMYEIGKTLLEKVNIIAYPEDAVDYYYEALIDQYEYYKQYYEYFGMTFDSLDEFVISYLGLEEGADWQAKTLEMARESVKERLVYYAIAEQENINITEQDYQDTIQYFIDYYKENTNQTYTADEIVEGLGEITIKENALFDKVTQYIVDNCTVSYAD